MISLSTVAVALVLAAGGRPPSPVPKRPAAAPVPPSAQVPPTRDTACQQRGMAGVNEVKLLAKAYWQRRGRPLAETAFVQAAAVPAFDLTVPEYEEYLRGCFGSVAGLAAAVPPGQCGAITLKTGKTVPKPPVIVIRVALSPTSHSCAHEYLHEVLHHAKVPTRDQHDFINTTLRWAGPGEGATNENLARFTKSPQCQVGGTNSGPRVRCSTLGEACSNLGDFSAPFNFTCTSGLACTSGRCARKPSGPPPAVVRAVSASCNKNTATGDTHFWSFNASKDAGEYVLTCDNGFTDTMKVEAGDFASNADAIPGHYRNDGWFYHGWSGSQRARDVRNCKAVFRGNGVKGHSGNINCIVGTSEAPR